MLFSSISFLYYFLPCVLILYHIVPKEWKNGALLLVSLVFYAWGEPRFVFLMMGMVLFHYLAGLLIGNYGQTPKGKMVLAGTLSVAVGVLTYYKFSPAAWPIGISFYTFQLISYVADVYRKTAAPQKSLVHLGAYVTMFPQLIAGPIVRYADVEMQLRHREHTFEKALDGISRFSIGLGKKILISNGLGELCEIFKISNEKSVLFFWLYAVSYTLQIYFDFSGYSDMAIGLGKMLGFEFLENFDYPYVSKSITEFWRRWHMSLGSWFRDYLYIPLGGNRVKKSRWYFNIFVVWSLTGLWHGAALNFLLWGWLFAAVLIIEKHWLLKKLEKARVWNHVYVMLLVIISFVIFNAKDMAEALLYIRGMFGLLKVPLVSPEGIYYLKSYGVLLTAAILGATPLIRNTVRGIFKTGIGEKLSVAAKPVMILVITAVCTAYLIDSSFNPFLYFRF